MFCWTVRYSLSDGTVFLAGQYGKACRRVRYSLLGSTVKLVGEYGILLRVPTDLKISAFAGLSSTVVSKRVGWPQEEGQICGPVRYSLSESTVSICWTVRYSGGDGCGPLLSAGTVFFDDVRLPLRRFLKRYVWGVPQGAICFGTMIDGGGSRNQPAERLHLISVDRPAAPVSGDPPRRGPRRA